MKCRKNYSLAMAIAARWFSTVAIPARAFQYGCAAERDERNGRPYTAAIQWRKAAELFPPETLAAEYFWHQWERVMQLPRRLAGPVEEPASAATLQMALSEPLPLPVVAIDQVRSSVAA